MGAYGNMSDTPGIAGLVVGMNPRVVESGKAQEIIAFGAPVMGFQNVEDKVYNIHDDLVTETLDADLVASNVLTTTINGIAIATTYATSHAATMTAHIAAINASAPLIALGISAEAGSTNRIILIKTKGLDLVVTGAVTAGASQANVAIVTSTWGKFLGVAMFTQIADRLTGAGTAAYQVQDLVNIVAEGVIWVPATGTVQDKQAAYAVIADGATQGKFLSTAGTNYNVGGYFRSGATNNLAMLEVRGLI